MIDRQVFHNPTRKQGIVCRWACPSLTLSRYGLGLRPQAVTLRVIITRRVSEGSFAAGPVPRSRFGLGLRPQAAHASSWDGRIYPPFDIRNRFYDTTE
jgi:hypothetical protein